MQRLYGKYQLFLHLQCAGRGTATSEIMDILGLGSTEKDVVLTFASQAPAAALLCGIASFWAVRHPPPVWGIQCRYPAVPGDPAPVPALSPVHVGSAHPDSYFCATEQITRADLLIYGQPVVLVALSLILPRTGWGCPGSGCPSPDPDPAGRRRVLLLHTLTPGTKPIPAAAPQQAVPSVSLSV